MKNATRRDVLIAGAGIIPVTGLWATAFAQDARTGAGVQEVRPGGPGAMMMSEDPALAACLLIGGRKQIEKSKFGQERAEHPDVKAFAQAEIKEHEEMRAKLTELGYKYPASSQPGTGAGSGAGAASDARPGEVDRTAGTSGAGTSAGTSPGVPNNARTTSETGTATGAGRAGGATANQGGSMATVSVGRVTFSPPAANMILIDHEVAEQCIASAKADLGKKTGLKFDMGYVMDQYVAHMGLLDHVQVFRRHASREMVPVLEQAQPIIEQHIATLRELHEKLEAAKTKNA